MGRAMGRYVISEAAKDDIRQMIAYIRKDSPTNAKRVRAELTAELRRLADFPLMGHLREDLTDVGLRFWTFYSYHVIYDPSHEPIAIVRVIHAARHFPRAWRNP